MKSNLHAAYETNSDFELNGIDLVVSDGVSFRVKRFGGKNAAQVKKLSAKYYSPYAKAIENKTLPESKEREIYVKIFVESCVVGWNGVKDDEGKDIEFSLSNAFDLLIGLPELFDTIVSHASSVANFRKEELEVLGNS